MELNEKLRGAVVGYAFGDALGLGTEFMTRAEVQTYYPEGLRRFGQIIRDSHRCQWRRGDWTNDTDILLCLLNRILEDGGFDLCSMARAVKKWLGTREDDVPAVLPMVCNSPGWEDHPIAVSHRVWDEMNVIEASNEAVGRSLLSGTLCQRKDIAENTRKLVLMTHDDTRCLASTVIIANMLHSLLYEDKEASYDDLKELSQRVDPRATRYLELAYNNEIGLMEVDDPETCQWTRKSLGSSLWGFWHGTTPGDCIYKVIELGGDSDTNASLTGAMVGMKHGYDALPEEKENILGFEMLIDAADRMADYIDSHWK